VSASDPTDSPERAAAGGCLCGTIRFEANGAPLWSAHCHCESCRRHTSAPVATYVGFPSTEVRFSKGKPSIYRSSPPVERGFCGTCGSPLSFVSTQWPGETHLFWPTFDEPAQFRPTRHVMFNEHLPGFDLYDDLPRHAPGSRVPVGWGAKPAARILFLCTGNSARSILGEAIVADMNVEISGERLWGHSAGSQPTSAINPDALAILAAKGHQTRSLRSKSWDEFSGPTAPALRWVITLCDSAAAESCPVFPGVAGATPQQLHWGLPDPAAGEASFEDTYQALNARIQRLAAEDGWQPVVTTRSAPR